MRQTEIGGEADSAVGRAETQQPDINSPTAPARGVGGKKRGAPTLRTPELLEAIFAGISLGRSARAMCVEVGISQRVLWNWLASDEKLMRQYLRAKELCIDAYAEEIIEISDDGSRDTYIDEKGREVTNREVIARAQLRIDARKWYAARLAPKKYGDKTLANQETGGKMPEVHKIEVSFVGATGSGKSGAAQ